MTASLLNGQPQHDDIIAQLALRGGIRSVTTLRRRGIKGYLVDGDCRDLEFGRL